MKIAFVVYRPAEPSIHFDPANDEPALILQFLRGKGLDIHEEAWANDGVQWKDYDCIVLKSPWDYVGQEQRFYQWLDFIKAMNIPLLNPGDTVKWNCDKHYLQDIERAGLNVIPTTFLEKGSTFDPADHFTAFNSDKLIVKPCISGASRNTFMMSSADTEITSTVNKLLQEEAMMVQPFMPAVIGEGEWSMLFFNGKFSHALLKTPVNNDFRSQPQFGANVLGKVPPERVLVDASRYVDEFAKDCLYARVDGLIINGVFHLMELELVDPVLFFDTYQQGFENYYEALNELISVAI